MENLVRLNKFIASNGVSSRRKIDELIIQGRVTVNGNTVTELGFKIDPATDKVKLDGESIRTSTKKIYIIFNKPAGVITSVSDEKHRATVIDLINLKEKIFPVGRLDYNTTGLLLLTNDGELANKLMHPKSEIYKTYFVKLSKPLEEKHRIKLTEGVNLEGRTTAPSKIRYPKKNNYLDLYISIYEGRNRQVRNMFEHYGYFVRELERTEYAGLQIGNLRPGEWRKLTPDELTKIQAIVKDAPATNTKRVHYAKREERNDYKKYKVREDRKEFKKEFKRPDTKFKVKDSKWGFKDKQIKERDVRLGFRKIETSEDNNYAKKNFKKFGKRDGSRDVRRDYKKFDKGDDKKDFKKFDKRDDRKDVKRDYKKYNDKKDVKRDYKKFDKRDDKKDFKKDFKKYDKRDDKKDVKRDFKKFDKRDDKKDVKRDFKKFGKKVNTKKSFKKKY